MNETFLAGITTTNSNKFYNLFGHVNDVTLGSTFGSASVLVNLCLGLIATSIANNFSQAQCTAASGTWRAGSAVALAAGNNSFTLNLLSAGVTRVPISATYALTGVAGAVNFDTFGFDFIETPEPPTSGLIGLSPAGLALLGARFRRKS